jgi:hypothetical protein
MLMRVSERHNEVRIELSGVTGRQESVLAALSDCQRSCTSVAGDGSPMATLTVRARTDHLNVRLRPSAGQQLDVVEIYRYLRRALIERTREVLAPRSVA